MAKKDGFDFGAFIKPVAKISVRNRDLFLYALTTSEVAEVKGIDASNHHEWFLRLLGLIGSFDYVDSVKQEAQKVSAECVANLSPDELEQIAETIVNSSFLRRVSAEVTVAARMAGENATVYLARALPLQIAEWGRLTREKFEHIGKQLNSPFNKVLQSSEVLREIASKSENERLNELGASAMRLNQMHIEQGVRVARERAKEIDAAERTAEMSEKSALALADLIATASVFLDKFDQRSGQADQDMRTQLRYALVGIVLSAVFALSALVVSCMSYDQDKTNNRSNDAWQDKVTEQMRITNDVATKQLESLSKLPTRNDLVQPKGDPPQSAKK
ncbi:MAG: hypothetical protein EAZ43_15015 [Betaproteobacteria bacterium]|nr:MAG: hypothetical protein EAZ43_15015 [Betaproteobacteria bacterium]